MQFFSPSITARTNIPRDCDSLRHVTPYY